MLALSSEMNKNLSFHKFPLRHIATFHQALAYSKPAFWNFSCSCRSLLVEHVPTLTFVHFPSLSLTHFFINRTRPYMPFDIQHQLHLFSSALTGFQIHTIAIQFRPNVGLSLRHALLFLAEDALLSLLFAVLKILLFFCFCLLFFLYL